MEDHPEIAYYLTFCERNNVQILTPVVEYLAAASEWYNEDLNRDSITDNAPTYPPHMGRLLATTDGELTSICALLTHINTSPHPTTPPLTHLSLYNGAFTANGITALAQTLEADKRLTTLRLATCPIGDTGALCIAESLLRNPHTTLTSLDLTNVNLDVRGLEALTTAACEIRTLKVLGVADNGLKKQAGIIIGRAMRLRLGLPGVHLASNNLCSHGLAAIGGALAVPSPNLRFEMLDISHNNVETEGLLAFAKGLKMCVTDRTTPLTILRFRGNPVGCAGAVAIANILKTRSCTLNATLKELDMGDCDLKAEGVTALCAAWPFCQSLISCDVAMAEPDPAIIEAAGKGLSMNSSLTRVDISPTPYDEPYDSALANAFNLALGVFAESLRSNTTLLTLNLGHYIANPHASQTAGVIQSTLMLNARLKGMNGVVESGTGITAGDETTASVLTAMSNAVAATSTSYLNGRLSPGAQGALGPTHGTPAPQAAMPHTPAAMNPFGSPPIDTPLQPVALGSALLTQHLKTSSQLMQTDAVRAARSSWDAEQRGALEQMQRSCEEKSTKALMETEVKLVEIVGGLAEDYAKMEENYGKKMAALEEKMAGVMTALDDKLGDLTHRVAAIEGRENIQGQKIDTIIRALHAVEGRTNDGEYIRTFVEKQYTELKQTLKEEVRSELNVTHEKAVTNLEVNRHIDHSRLDGKCSQLGERLVKLERTVVEEQQNTVQVLEMLLSQR